MRRECLRVVRGLYLVRRDGADHLGAQHVHLRAHHLIHGSMLVPPRGDPAHHRGNEQLFDVREREIIRPRRDGGDGRVGEAQRRLQRPVPLCDVGAAFLDGGQVERVLTVEAAGTVDDGGVQPFGVIRCGQGQDARVA